MPSALTAALAGGALAAVMYLTVLTGSVGGMMLVYLAPLPLLLVGLAYGNRTALIAVALGTVILVATAGGWVLAAVYLVVTALPALVVVRQSLLARQLPDGTLQWYPSGLLLMVLTGVAAVVILVAELVALGLAGADGLFGVIRGLLMDPMLGLLPAAGTPEGASVRAAVDTIAQVFPGVVAVSWLLMVIVNTLLAQAVLVRFGRLLRPPATMVEVTLPAWTPLALALTLAGAVVLDGQPGFVMSNLAIVGAVPFLFAGLAVVHAFAASRSSPVVILVVFYLIVSLLAWPLLAVVGLGLIEQWAGLRQRFSAGGSGRGEA
jgi:hypothetical protein